jgi:hypothetical protein
MLNTIVAPSLVPSALPLLDAGDPLRAASLVVAVATLAALAWLAGLAHHRPAPRPVVARHTFERLARGHGHGHRGTSAA